MGRVFFDVGVSLDGFIAGPNRGTHNPLGDGGRELHEWLFRTASFREHLKLDGDGERSPDDDLVREVFERSGASIMGRHMFDEGEASWPEEAPFHSPVFVLTHTPRAPWVRPGGTTFYFVTDGIGRALDQARTAAGDKDVRISGGGETIREYLAAGVIDEFTLHVAPRLLGAGTRLFEPLAGPATPVEQVTAFRSPLVTHIRYRVVRPHANG